MWFRTALLLVLFLLAWRFVRELASRMNSLSGTASERVGSNGSTPRGAADSRPPGNRDGSWPPGEITDVTWRDAESDTDAEGASASSRRS